MDKQRWFAAVAFALFTAWAVACGDTGGTGPEVPTPARLALDHPFVKLAQGGSATLEVHVYDQNDQPMTDVEVAWSSSDPHIATVERGTVRAHRAGTTAIRASAGDASITAIVEVVAVPAPIAMGDTVEGELRYPGELHVYHFTAPEAQDMNVLFEPLSGADVLQLHIYVGHGTEEWRQVRGVQAGSTSAWYEKVSGRFILLAGGDYTVTVRGAHPDAVGAYRFLLFPIDRRPESVPDTLAFGDVVVGESIAPLGDIDEFRFRGREGQEVNVFFQLLGGSGILDVDIYENYGEPGSQFVKGIMAGPASDLAEYRTRRFTLRGDATYTIHVRGSTTWDVGSYNLEIYPVDRRPESIPVTVSTGETISGEALDRKGDVDEFTFTGRAGETFVVHFDQLPGSVGKMYLEVYERLPVPLDQRPRLWGSSSGGAGPINPYWMILPNDGEYTVIVFGDYDAAEGPYRFWMEPIDRRPEHVPAAIAFGDTISGESIGRAGDVDDFTFTGKAGQEIVVFLQTLDGECCLKADVFKPFGTPLEARFGTVEAQPSEHLDTYHTGRLVLPDDGTYTITVKGSLPHSTGAYRLLVLPIDRRPESVPATVSMGDTIVGESIHAKGDIDEFTLTMTEGEPVIIEFEVLSGRGALDLSGYIHYGTPEQMPVAWLFEVTPGVYTTGGPIYYPRDGKVTIIVKGYADHGVGEYVFRVLPVEDLRPERVPAEVAIGDTVEGESIDWPGDSDWFRFKGTAGQVVDIIFQPYGEGGVLAIAVNDRGGTYESEDLGWVEGPPTSSDEPYVISGVTLPRDAVYTIDVWGRDGSTGPYRFQIRPRT